MINAENTSKINFFLEMCLLHMRIVLSSKYSYYPQMDKGGNSIHKE